MSEMAEDQSYAAISGEVLTATSFLLHRRTRHAAIRAIHAAVAGLGFEQGVAVAALVEPLAGIFGHGFLFLVSAVRAGEP